MHYITIPDGFTLNPGDLSWDDVRKLGQVAIFERSTRKEFLERAKLADIIVVNKQRVDEQILTQLSQLQCICVSATGYNNVDVEQATRRGIPVCNVVGYASNSVAQHVFALILELTNHVYNHSKGVHEGEWSEAKDWSYWKKPITELSGQTIGIYGLGKIGQQVARIALAFGMQVLATHRHPQRDAMPGVEFVSFDTLCKKSDILTLHAPLSKENRHIINQESLRRMKTSAMLINTGRGGLIREEDLREALDQGVIAGAGLDVLSSEPPPRDHLLLGAPNCILTPHQAWASRASRQRLLTAVSKNIQAFISGAPTNVVNPQYKDRK